MEGWWLVAASFGTAGGTVALIAALWQYRGKPGAGWFLASLCCQALWGAVYGLALLTFDPGRRRLLGILGAVLLVGLGVYFVAFALEYTGRASLRGRQVGIVVALAPVGVLALAMTNPVHGLLWTEPPTIVRSAGLAGTLYGFRPGAKAIGGLAVGVVSLGSLLLFDTVVSYGRLYRREAIAVGLSPVPPMTALVIWLFEIGPAPELNFAPLLFLVHLVFDAYAFVGSDMFEFHPATRRRGERAAIDDLGNPVVIVDERGRIVTTNDAAADVLGVEKSAVLGRRLDDHLDDDVDYETGGEVTVRVDGTPHTFSVTATPLAVDDDRVGSTLVWQDVTEARRREQRLAVLNRVLRHNLRNDMTVVRGFASSARDRVNDEAVGDMLETAIGKTDHLLGLGETAREIERTLEGDPRRDALDVTDVVEKIVRDVAGPECVELTTPSEPTVVETDRETLQTVVGVLVDNAIEHGTTTGGQTVQREAADGGMVETEAPVRVRVEHRQGAVVVVVGDDGPGIPEGELAVVEGREETALDHGSGLGLWLARWGAEQIGADLDFETGPEGTTATLSLPLPPESNAPGTGVASSAGTSERPLDDEDRPAGIVANENSDRSGDREENTAGDAAADSTVERDSTRNRTASEERVPRPDSE